MIPQEKNHFDYLDTLRGCAVLSVCMWHMLGYLYHICDTSHPLYKYIKFLIVESIDWGRFGVVLFFLISGFIIPNSLKPSSSLKKFFISRIFRLYPAYWLALAVLFISAPYLEQPPPVYSQAQLLANITMAPKIFGNTEMSGIFWTLFIELLFYSCCAVLFIFNWLDKSPVIALVAIGLNLTTPLAIVLNTFFHVGAPVQFILFQLSFLFAGNLLRLAFTKKDKVAGYSVAIFFLLALLTIPITSGIFFPVPEAIEKGFVMHTSKAVVYAYFFALGLFVFSLYFKSFNNRFMMELGKVSYSLYLLHMQSFVLITKIILPTTISNFFFYLLASALLAYTIAKLMFNYIESPAIALGRKIITTRGYN